MTQPSGFRLHAAWALAMLVAASSWAPAAHALEEQRGEEAAIKACDKRLCTIVMQKDAKGDDLRCSLTKTWAKSTIKEADSHKVSWTFGDARCTAEINLGRAPLVAVLVGDKRKFFVPSHTANCLVEQDGKLEKLTATIAPKIVFKDGKAEKVWINLKEIEGPAGIKGTIQTAAQLADGLGLFHRQMIKAINRYIERHCPKEYPQLVNASPTPHAANPKSDKK